jgi:hypothetical protein
MLHQYHAHTTDVVPHYAGKWKSRLRLNPVRYPVQDRRKDSDLHMP